MLGRPNLARDNCDRISVQFNVSLPEAIGAEATAGSVVYQDQEGRDVTLYGKIYSQNSVVLETLIFRAEQDNYFVNSLYIRESRNRPPKTVKSPDHLMDLILANASGQVTETHTYGIYRYKIVDGWNSDPVALPISLDEPWRIVRGMPFTRIDGMSLSHESNDKILERVDIELSEEGEIIHTIPLHRERQISKSMIRGLIREGRRLSSGLVEREDEGLGN